MPNWKKVLAFAAKLPDVVRGLIRIVEHVKGAAGAEKKAAVLSAIPESVALAEYIAERDLLNDEMVKELLDAAIEAQVAAEKAWKALRDLIVDHGDPGP